MADWEFDFRRIFVMNVLRSFLALTVVTSCFCVSGEAQTVASAVSSRPKMAPAERTASAAPKDKAVQEVQAAFDRYIDGWKRADIEALSHVYATDARVTGIWPDPTLEYPVQGWTEVRRELERVFDYGKGMNMSYTPRHVEIYGDMAIISTNWEWIAEEAAPGTPEAKLAEERRREMKEQGFGSGQATFVFQHRGTRWVLVHEHASVLAEYK
jgi:ketosteroid isomerase-like protein